MPTDVWTAELSFDNFSYTPNPDPSGGRFDAFWVGLEAVCLPVLDPFPQFNPSPDDGNFFLAVGMIGTPTFFFPAPGAFQVVTVRLGDAEIQPPQWQIPSIITRYSGDSLALLTGTVTLSITKDYDADLMTFTGPLGVSTVALSALDALPGGPYGYFNTTPLRPRGFAQRLQLPEPTGFDPAYDVDDQVKWYDLIGRQNGTPYDTVALSSADPGNWWPINSLAFSPITGTFDPGLAPWWTYTQEALRERVRAQVFAAAFPEWRQFITWKRRRPVMAANPLDLTVMPEHDALFALWESMPGEATVRRSHTDARTWKDLPLESGTPTESPSIQCFAGQVWVCYYDGSQIVTQVSKDLGLSWSVAVPVSFAGTNPRLVISPEGMFFFFYFDGTTLALRRSTDYGASFLGLTPIPITLALTPQDFGAVWAADRRLVVSYINAGNWESKYSLDLGSSWALV